MTWHDKQKYARTWRYAVSSPVIPTIVTDAKDFPSGAYALDTWVRMREERNEKRREGKGSEETKRYGSGLHALGWLEVE